jgi:cytochrome c oxidase subunit I
MPRRYYNYIEVFEPWHRSSTVGAYILGVGFTMSAVVLISSLFKGGTIAPDNPWNAQTLEWTHTQTPPIEHNFHEQPVVTKGPYDFAGVEDEE